MHSLNKVNDNIAKIGALFPNCVTERKNDRGEVEYAIDFDMLRQELSDVVVEGPEQRYQFTWPDKRKSVLLANAPINKTLRPCRAESVGRDGTPGGFDSENLYIEGDNLEVLKLLQETYLGKIKMIYIDPPYNTGNDFVYEDDFAQSAEEYMANSGQFDEEGNRLVHNTESNGRFHTDWLNMIYPRLKMAKNLLAEDGVIFISIGENELDNTIKIGSEIFGATNLLGIISRVAKTASNKGTFFAPTNDYIIALAKNSGILPPFYGEVDEGLYPKIEINGERKGEKYRDDVALYQSALDPLRGCINQRYYIKAPDGSLLIPPGKTMPEKALEGAHIAPKTKEDKVWRWSYETYYQKKDILVFKETKTSPLIDENGNRAKYNIYTKSYLSDRQDTGTLPRTIWTDFINRKGADLLKKMRIPFDFSKPYELVEYILKIISATNDDYVLDFFSGSATTAHAVMQYNATNNCSIKHIMVQLPEKTDTKSEAYKAGYKNICEIGKERIRRAGRKIKEDSPLTTQNLDVGFRVLKCESSNMKDVYYNPDEYGASLFDTLADNIKEDRTPEDLLFQVMLDLGVLLSSEITETVIAGKKVFDVADGFLMACFDENVTEETITAIAKMQPYYFVMRDSSMANDSVATNFDQLFNTYSPSTVRKVL